MAKIDLTKNNIIFEDPLRIKSPLSWEEHIPFAFFLIETLKPGIFVELGVYNGNSYYAFCQAVKKLGLRTKCFGVDSWEGDKQSGFYGNEVYEELVKFNESYKEFSELLRMHFDEALDRIKDKSIDLLHIDGLHTYEAVKHDFENWLPKMSDKGVIILHDTQVKRDDFGVWKLWEEISNNYPSFEFKHGCGLGILAIGEKTDKEFIKFINDLNDDGFAKNLFAKLGASISKSELVRLKEDENKQLNTLLERKDQSLKQKEGKYKQLDALLRQKDQYLIQKEEIIKLKDAHIANLDGIIKDKSVQISTLEYSIKKIKSSFSYKAGNIIVHPLAAIRDCLDLILMFIKARF